ncbi:hypothetical protein QBC44DRAFT_391015 [Cladorrhinum sp. PSN332]|nr:hypothetical protein QBC44DRAFT_391015 [Cladorrhinum sp. PSN332]
MFELPDAKRVRREDLYDSDRSDRERDASPELEGENDAELREKLNAKLSSLLAINLSPAGGDEVSAADRDGGAEEAEFDFRLFSTSAPSQKVVIGTREEEAIPGEHVPFARRPMSHYIRGELTAQEKEQFRLAAVSAEDVFNAASQRAWGYEVPWRVTRITVVGHKGQQHQPVFGTAVEAEGKRKKTRPGKKTRIVLRTREKAKREEMEKRKAEVEKRQNQLMSKEEHMREKKKRLNRERKLKRKMKEKEKKGVVGGGGGDDDGGSDASELFLGVGGVI